MTTPTITETNLLPRSPTITEIATHLPPLPLRKQPPTSTDSREKIKLKGIWCGW
ncbi:hypothetical protein L211DRAFT_83994 [Terfezia boudieri ATCC MYA-4762]|uniref:Uncharacterized protein n=1 Tax=Terfezia boudieri ATCC MYA-4762 TaxID=1051890 RepID=A0A3N4LWD1_9PEZI|nr:hypothetical protein L211DRAFT_83994 [Terfezia boudieri ATCC MYA-4762]